MSELASIDDAIAAAKNRVLITQAVEADAAKRASAKEALPVIAEFKKVGRDLDRALATVADRSAALMDLLRKLHQTTGQNFPSREQLDGLGYAAVMTAVLKTPWGHSFRPIPPSQRREFAPLFDGWAQVIEGRLQPLLIDEDAAA